MGKSVVLAAEARLTSLLRCAQAGLRVRGALPAGHSDRHHRLTGPFAGSQQLCLGLAARCLVVAVMAGPAACSSDAPPPVASLGGAGNANHGGSAGGAVIGGNGGVGGRGGAGSGGAGGTPASVSGAGQGGGGASGGSSGAAGTSGSGAGGAPSGGSAGASDDRAAAAALNGYQLLDPCQSSYAAVATPGDVCPQDSAVKNQKLPLQFGGDAQVTYEVTLRVRGIMEGYWYAGGTLDPVSKTFYTGGVPTIDGNTSACKNKTSELPFSLPAEITPVDNCWNGFNVFALTVSQPSQHYYLNYTAEKNGDRPPHAVYTSDYTVTIPIQGQAKLEFYVIGSDEHECYNFDKVLPGVTTSPSPYIGEFVDFEVMNVTRAQ